MKIKEDVTIIKGIGPEMKKKLLTLQIATVGDLIHYFPYRYEHYKLSELNHSEHGQNVTVEGVVHRLPTVQFYGKNRSRLMLRLLVQNHVITAVLFNRAFLQKRFTLGQPITVTGKWDRSRSVITVTKIEFQPYSHEQAIQPIYSLREGIYQNQFQRFVKIALQSCVDEIKETLPLSFRQHYKLVTKKEALFSIHFPKSHYHLKQARRRIVYEELLLFQLKLLALRKFVREHRPSEKKVIPKNKLDEMISQLPFQLTKAQMRVLGEVLHDLQSPYQMNRLLQGDVGSGKTVVAMLALYGAVLAGFQGALMVPTEILAEQHAHSLAQFFSEKEVTVALLTSSVKGKKREQIMSDLQSGALHILIGTHALIQDDVSFHNLGLVITDEQHRFGVEQRRLLKEKGLQPDVLFMTATPIPRTLAISTFGDMDVSTIDEMPAGRKMVKTYWVKDHLLQRVYTFLRKKVKLGEQAYIICPLIEDSDKLDVQNAMDVYAELVQQFPDIPIGLMHGRLAADEKERVMEKFSANELSILVSTTVVEVGVNVPNATLMIIYNADRFGLAQLHQLRGRVGRGDKQSYCILIANPKSSEGQERMKIMTETNDGFLLSEKDLEIRGPGDFFGEKQSGVPEFKLADLAHDQNILEIARADAEQLVHSDSFWQSEQYNNLRNELSLEDVIRGEKLD